jgi:Domain of Unknown Function (DUF748)
VNARLRRWLLGVVVVLLILGAAVIVALPMFVRQLAIWQLQAQTGRTVTIEALDLSLLTGRFSVRGFRVADRDGGLLAEFERLEGRFHRRSLAEARLWIESVTLTNGHVRIVRVAPNRFNISDLLERPRTARGGLDVDVEQLAIAGGWVEMEDRVLTPTRTWRSENLRLDARNVSTRQRSGIAVGSTTLAGALVNVRVEDLQLFPVHLRASINVRDLDLTLAALYMPADTLLTVESGVFDAAFTVVTDARDGTTVNAEGVVRNVALVRPGIPGQAVTTPELQILVRELHQQPDSIRLRYASVGGDVTVLDPTTSPPTPLTFSDLTFTASGLEQPMRGPAQVAIHALLPGGGEVDAGGTLGLQPRRVDLRVRARRVALASIARYLPFAGHVQGTGAADLRVVATHERTLTVGVTGDATLERLSVSDGARPLATAVRVGVTGLDYATPARVRIAELTLAQPALTLEREAGGAINLAALARPPASAAPATGPAAPRPPVDVEISRLRIADGRAVVTDAASGGRVEVTRLAFTAEDLTWPSRTTTRIQLTAGVAGGDVTAQGTVDASRKRAQLALKLHGVDLATAQPWLPITGRVRGAADADVTATVAMEPFELAVRGSVGAASVAVLDATRPLLTVGRVDATGIDLIWPTRLAIDRLRVNTPWAEIARNTRGELSLRALFARRPDRPAPATESAAGAGGPVPGMQVTLREAQFENGGATIIDDAVEPAARFEMRGSHLDLRHLTWPARGSSEVQLSTPMPGGGTLSAHGTFSIEPTRLALETALDQVDLAPARPYLPFDARLAGKVSGRAKVTGAFGDTISLVVDGDAGIDRFRLGDAERRLATAERVELNGFRYQFPTSVRMRQVSLHKPWLLVERDSKGQLEIVSLFRARKAPVPAPAAAGGGHAGTAAPTTTPGVRVLIDKLTTEDGFVRFVDHTTDPDYAEELSAITVTAEGLGTDPARRGTVDLRGTFASGTPLTVRGQLGGLTGPRVLDITVDVREFPVPRLNPYLDRLSAWIARQGTLTATLHYKVNGDDLEASNEVALDGLEVEEGGRGAEFSRRIGLPLGTLVSLLKDRHGNIKLSLPVGGRLSSPDFEYSEAVWAALRNVTVRLVTLPFSLIGKVFFSEDSRIQTVQVDPVAFPPAKATPTAEGTEHLRKLAEFLTESPGIRLRLRPVTTVADVTALRREALDSRLATLGSDEAARRQAAIGLYTELFPRRQPPTSDEALYEELTRETPPAPRALRTLATERVAATRDALVTAGVAGERLEPQESRTAVESEGDARVEFEVVR